MEFLSHYGLFLAKIVTLVVAILLTVAGLVALLSKGKEVKEQFTIKKINEKYDTMRRMLKEATLDKKQLRSYLKQEKQAKKQVPSTPRRKIFVLNFQGDIKASAVETLRQEITAILTSAEANDEVVLNLESPGGLVHAYGLAASQLQRIRDRKIPLTVCVDKVAASGGYLMASVADHILAAPFAIIGSIGVLAQIPNFNRLLKENHIDFEQLTAGEYKRTLTLFGENTDIARKKFKDDLDLIHVSFKEHILKNRPKLDIEKVATGEHWLATKAHELQLIDRLSTSDDYLLKLSEQADLYEVIYTRKKNLKEKLLGGVQSAMANLFF